MKRYLFIWLLITSASVVIAYSEIAPTLRTSLHNRISTDPQVISHLGPPPAYVQPTISLDHSVLALTGKLTVNVNFTVEQDIALDETRLSFYPIGKQEAVLSVPFPEWSHVSLKQGDNMQREISVVPAANGLDPGYYQATLEFQIGGTRISASADLQISYPKGTTRIDELIVNQSVAKEGYTLTIHSVTMQDDKAVFDAGFSPQALELTPYARLDNGRQLRLLEPLPTRDSIPEHVIFTFSPIPKSARQVTFELESILIQKPDGKYGVPGHWTITIPLP